MYATETGKSERFASTLCEIFKHAFDAKVFAVLSSWWGSRLGHDMEALQQKWAYFL